MPVKLIALDLDGTTLRRDGTVSQRNREAIRRAVAAGVHVTIATGRIHASAAVFARSLGLSGPVISSNGGMIAEAGGQALRHCPLPAEIFAVTWRLAAEFGVYAEVYAGRRMFVTDPVRKRRDDLNLRRLLSLPSLCSAAEAVSAVLAYRVHGLGSWRHGMELPEKVMFCHPDGARLQLIRGALVSAFGDAVVVTNSGRDNVEVTAPGGDKGSAVAWLADRYQLLPGQVMVMGDNHNDLSMFTRGFLGVAMGNAEPELKARAAYVTGSNQDDGVAGALERFVAGEGAA